MWCGSLLIMSIFILGTHIHMIVYELSNERHLLTLFCIACTLTAAINLWMSWSSVRNRISVASTVGVMYGIAYYAVGKIMSPELVTVPTGVYIGVLVACTMTMGMILSADESWKTWGKTMLVLTHGTMVACLLLWLMDPEIAAAVMFLMMEHVMLFSMFIVVIMMFEKDYSWIRVISAMIVLCIRFWANMNTLLRGTGMETSTVIWTYMPAVQVFLILVLLFTVSVMVSVMFLVMFWHLLPMDGMQTMAKMLMVQ